MGFAKKLFQFLVFSNIFIAGCALLMVVHTVSFLLRQTPDPLLLLFIFFATLCSYSFHWYLTPATSPGSTRIRWLLTHRWVHVALLLLGAAGAAVTGLQLLDHWRWLLLSAFITFLYSAPMIPHPMFRVLRKIAIGKTIFLALVWAFVTAILPILMADVSWKMEFTLFAGSRFFLIYAICILFDYRDREYDISIGIKSLITWLNKSGVLALFFGSVLISIICTLALYASYPSVVDQFILLAPVAVTTGLLPLAIQNRSDILYYFVLDGLMALSGILMMLKKP